MLRRTLARALFVLAASNAALLGCKTDRPGDRDSEEAAVRKPDGLVEVDGKAEVSKGEVAKERAKMPVGATTGTAAAGAPALYQAVPPPPPATGSEDYRQYDAHAWIDAAKDHLSTFAADVDTASYTIARRKLTEGALPPPASVRVEEFVNYFRYGYSAPTDRPFGVHVDAAPSPFHQGRHIVRVGVTSRAKSEQERKRANLVFLVDTSGSMQGPDRLELAKRALTIMTHNLRENDQVSLVTYAGDTRVVLPATGGDQRAVILAAIEELAAGGGTAMGSGMELAYQQAAKMMGGDSITRVIVLSDGDANIGAHTTHEQILSAIEGHVAEGITLSTIGFGMGNYKDTTMEQLANKGNGNNYYIDGLSQAKRVFEEQLGAMLEVVAKDVKLQVDFDPQVVSRYRLIGYENRDVADADFRQDQVDAGEIGAGHQVTALYEVELRQTMPASLTQDDPMLTVRVRHKEPKGSKATEAAFGFAIGAPAAGFEAASDDLQFAFAAAAFADVLRGAEDAEHWSLAKIREIAAEAAGQDADRAELVTLIDRAIALKGRTAMVP